MSSNPKVNIPTNVYESIKKLPESQRKATLVKAVTKAAKEAGYTQADLLKDTTHISFKINTRFKTIEKSSEKSKVIKDMSTDVEAEKENELKEKAKKEQEANQQEQDEKEKEKEKDEKEPEKDKDKQQDGQEQEEDKQQEKNPNALKIAITDRLLEEISGLSPEEAKKVIRANVEGQARAQGFDMEKLHRPCGGLSINDAEKNETASASTPNGSTMLDNLVEVVYASCKGYSVEEQAQACEEGDSRHMSDKNVMEGSADMIRGMVNPQPEQAVELERGGLEPGAYAPSGLTPPKHY